MMPDTRGATQPEPGFTTGMREIEPGLW